MSILGLLGVGIIPFAAGDLLLLQTGDKLLLQSGGYLLLQSSS